MYSTFSILFICFIFGHFIRCAHNRMHIQKSSQKLCAAQLLLVFRHIFTDKILSFVTSPFHPFPMLLFWRTSKIFTQMLKFSSNLCINLPYFEHISTIWFFFISYILIRILHDMFRSKSVYRHKIGVAFATWVSPLSSTLLIHNK